MIFSYEKLGRRSVVRTRVVAANEVRIPEPVSGEAVVIQRYGKAYAAVVDAATFELFQRMLGMFGEQRPAELSLSDAALEVHRASEVGEDIEEFDFGLLDTHAAT
jgi:hypothetical protein